MRLGEAHDADHQRRVGQAALFDLDIGGRRAWVLLREHLCDHLAATQPRIALEHDEAPGGELAMVGHARADGQNGIEFGGRGTGGGHLARLHRAAGLQQFNSVGHENSMVSRFAGDICIRDAIARRANLVRLQTAPRSSRGAAV